MVCHINIFIFLDYVTHNKHSCSPPVSINSGLSGDENSNTGLAKLQCQVISKLPNMWFSTADLQKPYLLHAGK